MDADALVTENLDALFEGIWGPELKHFRRNEPGLQRGTEHLPALVCAPVAGVAPV